MGKLCSVVKVWGLLLNPAIHCNVCSALLLWFSLMTSSSMSVSASGESCLSGSLSGPVPACRSAQVVNRAFLVLSPDQFQHVGQCKW